MDMVSAGIIGLAFILLVVFCVLASKTWHWLNIASVVLAFIMGTTAIIGLAKVTKLRTTAVKKYQAAVEKLEKDTASADQMVYGDRDSITYDPGSLRYIVEKLNRQLAGRGRTWAGGTVAVDGEDRVFTFPSPRAADAQSLKEVVLHAFVERQALPGIPSLPAVYVGSVRVSAESPENLKLQPVALAAEQLFRQPPEGNTWTLFEKMPLDRRGSFKDATIALAEINPEAPDQLRTFAEQLSKGNEDLDLSEFRKVITTNFLPAQLVGLPADSKEYEQLIDRYVFDGQSLGRIQNWIDANSASRKNNSFEPPPEEVFFRYRFDKKSTKAFQVDATGNIETDGLFTGLGLAVDQSLHAGKDITFQEGDTVLVDGRSANGYRRDEQTIQPLKGEPVTEVGRIYIRSLRNFPYEFKSLTSQAASLEAEYQTVLRNNLVQDQSYDDAQKQIAVRVDLIAKHEEDRENLQNDLTTASSALAVKQQENAELKQTIASTRAAIDSVYKQLREAAVQLSRKAFAGR
ncbi:MAG: hypothetical protein AB8B55_06580 [Mariniblastus sp.]